MDLRLAMVGFYDELQKIADISIAGLSPKTVLEAPTPQPMETLGVQRAKRILDIADEVKLAAAEEDSSTYDKAKKIGLGAGSGAGLGNLASRLTLKQSRGVIGPKRQSIGTLAGAGAGALLAALDDKLSKKKHAAFSPGNALKASRMTGQVRHGRRTPGLKRQIGGSLVGRKFTIPTPGGKP